MNELGAGIDIIAVSRMRHILENSGKEAFLRKVFTEEELCRSRVESDSAPVLARIFAAKEAVFKTFCIEPSDKVQLRDIEIGVGECGQPVAVLKGYFAELARERRVKDLSLSLSYDGDYAVAMAVLQCAPAPYRKGSNSSQTKYFRRAKQSPTVKPRTRRGVDR